MRPSLNELYQRVHEWVGNLRSAGWLTETDALALERVEHRQVEQLFRAQSVRPLIVALFGGTGVGKSSLLNRLAGEPIARVGVERPTSQEVTLYLHEDFKGNLLPEELPTRGTRIAWHHDERRRLIAWLDMPDFDSTEVAHREQVVAWLPYIDWLIYVVSPERYHDDLGWRFLRERGQRHSWLFVMNHWDQGVPAQLDDLRRKLVAEGFANPVVLRTSCGVALPDDEFHALEGTIRAALRTHGLELLQKVGAHARAGDLRDYLAQIGARLGTRPQWEAMGATWRTAAGEGVADLRDQLNMQLAAALQHFAVDPSAFDRLLRARGAAGEGSPLTQLWQPRNDTRIADIHLTLVTRLQQAGLPHRPAAALLEGYAARPPSRVRESLEAGLLAAIQRPGGALQRHLHRVAGGLTWALPLIAASWVVYHVVTGFYAGTQGQQAFLGLDFAVHSGLLIGLAWLVPWLGRRATKPSLAASVDQALRRAIDESADKLTADYAALWQQQFLAWENRAAEHQRLTDAVEVVAGQLARVPDQYQRRA